MNKLLSIELAALLLLVAASLFARLDGAAAAVPTDGPPDTWQTGPAQTTAPVPAQSAPTEAEPPLRLTFAEDFTLESRSYFVYDCGEENLLAISGSPEERVYPASVTKLFTVYVALQYLESEATVTLGREVSMVREGSSLAYLKADQRITVAELVEGTLLPSGNDAAYALAVAAARAQSGNAAMSPADALASFAELMNDTARALGMTGSHFTNPDGYHDPDHYTTCGDLITIARLALGNELIRQFAATVTDRVTYSNGDIAVWNNTNALIDPNSPYYHADAVGLKTGHTGSAGYCVLSAFALEGDYIIVGTFGCQRSEDRYIDTLKLYDLVLDAKAK